MALRQGSERCLDAVLALISAQVKTYCPKQQKPLAMTKCKNDLFMETSKSIDTRKLVLDGAHTLGVPLA